MDNLVSFTKHGVTLLTRQDTYGDDRGVLDEALTYNFGPGPINTVLDLGSHIGAVACWLAQQNPKADILAIEPEPSNFAVLQRNIEQYPNVTAMQTYVTYADSSQDRIMVHPSHSTCSMIVKVSEADPTWTLIDAPKTTTLEQVMAEREWDILSLLKIDIEGAEEDVLLGCSDEILIRTLCITGEFHRGIDRFHSTIGQRLQHLGFTVTAETDPGRHAVFTASR